MKQIYTNIIFFIAFAVSISGCNNDKDSDTVPGNGTVNTQENSNTAFVVNGTDLISMESNAEEIILKEKMNIKAALPVSVDVNLRWSGVLPRGNR